MPKKFINAAVVAAAFLVTTLAVLAGSYFNAGVVLEMGRPAPMQIMADRTIVNTYATDANRQAALLAAQELPYVMWQDNAINERVETSLRGFFERAENVRAEYAAWQLEQAALLQNAADAWAAAGNPPAQFAPPAPEAFPESRFNVLGNFLAPAHLQLLLELPPPMLAELKAAVLHTTAAVMYQGVAEADAEAATRVVAGLSLLPEDLPAMGQEIVLAFLTPNFVVNETADAAARAEIAGDYLTEFIWQGQLIVSAGAIVNAEMYAALGSLGLLETDWQQGLIPLLGVLVIIALVLLACCWSVYIFRKKTVARTKETLLLLTLYTCVLSVLWALDGGQYYFMPVAVFALLTAMLLDIRTGLLLNLGITVVGAFVTGGDMPYMVFFLISGSLLCLMAKFATERSKVIMVGLLAAGFNFVLSVAITLVFERNNPNLLWAQVASQGAFAGLNGIFTVIIAVGSLPLWEALFGVVTPLKLLDLTNPTNPLMRRLTMEAPGTYHHSLVVANLAESAAYDIGANPHAARAGGFYHDIGKLKFPQYFTENIGEKSPHEALDHKTSTQIIMGHVTHGLKLAAEYRLPPFLQDIIREHHGTTLVKYFYHKAKEALPPEETLDEAAFRYPQQTPKSRESAVVMLADTVEAAVRATLPQAKDAAEVRTYIHQLIKDKLNDGQLNDSGLTIRDLDTIADAFFRVLKGMHHERIVYPKEEPA